MELSLFNVQDGYAEALVRGHRLALLTPEDYRKLMMAETLEDLRSALEDTDYGGFLQDEPSPLAVTTIGARCREKMADEFRALQAQANYPMNRFLEFIVAERMIDNVVSLIQGAINKKGPEELLSRADPLGWTTEMKALLTIDASTGYEELYRTVLIETPVGRYFEGYLDQQEENLDRGLVGGDRNGAGGVRTVDEVEEAFGELDLEVMRASLKKSWLQDFFFFCQELGGTTAEVMSDILRRQADFLVLAVTLNSLNSPMGGATQLSDRNALYPAFGYLYPSGTDALRKAYNDATIRVALEPYSTYQEIYEQCKGFYIKDQDAGRGFGGDIDGNDEQAPEETSRPKKGPNGGGAVVVPKDAQLSFEDAVYRHEVKMYEMAFEYQMHYGVIYAWIKLREQEIRNILWIADMILMNRRDQMDQVLPIFAPRF